MGILYTATNRLDGKVYVGATSKPLYARRANHVEAARKFRRYGMLFHAAIREQGTEAFEWRVLCVAPNNYLRELETRYIEAARSKGVVLYNKSGGPGRLGLVNSEARRAQISAHNKGRPAHNKGKPMSDAQKAKMSATLTGRKRGPRALFQGKSYDDWAVELGITYKAVSANMCEYGHPWVVQRERLIRHHTDETKAKISIAAKNRKPISDETRAKLSEAQKGRRHSEETRAKMSMAHTTIQQRRKAS
jgi:group I intron endonuclease